ncbi:MAG: class II D-tagatose-bisphosphate aldolase, non-catalytic subunit [Desulfurococcaceae archaeon]|nr:class II D-tagatose-bisphosphate aldolase, non-catalytic subunit [Sulfolobales archaeon]MDW8169584.1 class II D-tagatose-bisphosphate aldolase, non-catalytic subunit [Desulfurococcaceae archaeon]
MMFTNEGCCSHGAKAIGVVRRILNRLKERKATLICISPISKYVVLASISALKRVKAPIAYIASLNQVDVDGGYTGWTPEEFKAYVFRAVEDLGVSSEIPIILQLDHGGPWLKDKHVASNYSYHDAVDSFLKSLEAFIRAGFNLIHIDTTVDMERSDRFAELETAANRTVDLISCAEEIAKQHGRRIEYEIGSDRWSYKPPEVLESFIKKVLSELRRRNIEESKVVFVATDVGTEVKPGNRAELSTVRAFSSLALKHGLYLKIHSGDYLENPEVLPESNVGGVNIGPMYAHVKYSVVKNLVLEKLSKETALELLSELNNLIAFSDKLAKYVDRDVGKVEEYKVGLASRYVWPIAQAEAFLDKVSNYTGIDVRLYLINKLIKEIEQYAIKLGLSDLAKDLQ